MWKMMRTALLIIATLVVSTCVVFAEAPTVLTSLVTDEAGVLSSKQAEFLTTSLRQFTKMRASEPEMGILFIKRLPPDTDIDKYRNDVFRASGIGKKGLNNGLLLVIATEDRKVGIEVGYGLEGYVTDALSSVIIQTMKPALRDGDWYGAAVVAVNSVAKFVPVGDEPPKVFPEKKAPVGKVILLILATILIIGSIIAFVNHLLRRRRVTTPTPVYNPRTDRWASYTGREGAYVGVPIPPRSTSSSRSSSSSRSTSSSSSDSYVSRSSDSYSSSSSSSDSGSSFGGGDSGGGGSSSSF